MGGSVDGVWRIASELLRAVPPQRDPEVGGHLSVVRDQPAGVRHAVAEGEAVTECGIPVSVLAVWEMAWPGDRGAVVCTECAVEVLRATEAE